MLKLLAFLFISFSALLGDANGGCYQCDKFVKDPDLKRQVCDPNAPLTSIFDCKRTHGGVITSFCFTKFVLNSTAVFNRNCAFQDAFDVIKLNIKPGCEDRKEGGVTFRYCFCEEDLCNTKTKYD